MCILNSCWRVLSKRFGWHTDIQTRKLTQSPIIRTLTHTLTHSHTHTHTKSQVGYAGEMSNPPVVCSWRISIIAQNNWLTVLARNSTLLEFPPVCFFKRRLLTSTRSCLELFDTHIWQDNGIRQKTDQKHLRGAITYTHTHTYADTRRHTHTHTHTL